MHVLGIVIAVVLIVAAIWGTISIWTTPGYYERRR